MKKALQPFNSKVEDFDTWCGTLQSLLVEKGLEVEFSPSPLTPESPEDQGESDDEFDSEHHVEIAEDEEMPRLQLVRYPSPAPNDTVSVDILGSAVLKPSTSITAVKRNSERKSRPGFFGTGNMVTTFSLRRQRKMTPTLKNMIGEAHLQLARGQRETAVEICMEVIKEGIHVVPTCVEPYNTLSMIYEDEPEKAHQFLFIAAFLQPHGLHDWSKIAYMSLEFGNPRQAMLCFKRAIAADPKRIQLQLRFGQLQEDMNELRQALKTYGKIVSDFKEDGGTCVIALRRTAYVYHKMGDFTKAYDSLRTALDSYAEYVTSAELNLTLDLALTLKLYVELFKVLIKFERVTLIPSLPTEAFISQEALKTTLQSGKFECSLHENMMPDLLAKLITTLIHLEAHLMNDRLGSVMLLNSADDFGDLFLDIAEAFMGKGRYESANQYLIPLIQSTTYSQAGVWLKHADCLFQLGRLEEAVGAYHEVVHLAPTHELAKLNLVILLQKLGRTDDAMETLIQAESDSDLLNPELLIEKCNIFYTRKQFQEFIEVALLLFYRHSLAILEKDEPLIIVMASNFGKRRSVIEADRVTRRIPETDEEDQFLDREVSFEKEYRLYLRLCRLLISMERWDLLAAVTFASCTSSVFAKANLVERDSEMQCFFASVMCGDTELVPHHIRTTLTRLYKKTVILNLFSLALQTADHGRYVKHVSRIMARSPNDTRIMLMNANLNFATGSFKNAMLEYMSLFVITPEDPLIPLMISIILLHIFHQKTSRNRISLMSNIMGFLTKYLEIQGECPEVHYNMGRTFQTVRLPTLAVYHYQAVLKMESPPEPPDKSPAFTQYKTSTLDLKCEAAYNLAQIYRESGHPEMARYILFKYIRI